MEKLTWDENKTRIYASASSLKEVAHCDHLVESDDSTWIERLPVKPMSKFFDNKGATYCELILAGVAAGLPEDIRLEAEQMLRESGYCAAPIEWAVAGFHGVSASLAGEGFEPLMPFPPAYRLTPRAWKREIWSETIRQLGWQVKDAESPAKATLVGEYLGEVLGASSEVLSFEIRKKISKWEVKNFPATGFVLCVWDWQRSWGTPPGQSGLFLTAEGGEVISAKTVLSPEYEESMWKVAGKEAKADLMIDPIEWVKSHFKK